MHKLTYTISPYRKAFSLLLLIVVMTSYRTRVNQSDLLPPSSTDSTRVNSAQDSLDYAVKYLMEEYNIPGVSIALIDNGKISESKNYGVLDKKSGIKVNGETMFSVGSVSKVGNAFLTLKLVEDGLLDLDENINIYMKDWQIEKGKYNKETDVTLRHLLSHTAGLSVHGFADFYPGEDLPSTLEILNSDGPAKNKKVKLILPVGQQSKYSGGGTTVIQKIVEDVTEQSYPDAAKSILFDAFNLKRSTYENPVPSSYGNIAKAHNKSGKAVALPRGYQAMPEMAASGLWTSTNDFAKVLVHILNVKSDTGETYLTKNTVEEMITPQKNSNYGLGPRILKEGSTTKVMHGGSNESYKANFTLFWEAKKGFVVFTNGSNGTKLIKDLKPALSKYLGIEK